MNQETITTSNLTSDTIEKADLFFLASFLSQYPGESFESIADKLEILTPYSPYNDLCKKVLSTITSPQAIEELRSDYVSLFDRGKSENSLYGTEYGLNRSFGKTTELADLSAFYQAFGMEMDPDDGKKEMLDHVAVELEFYGVLLLKQDYLGRTGDEEGVSIVRDAQKKFLEDYLGRFANSLHLRPGIASHDFYREVFNFIKDLLENEILELNANVIKKERKESESETEEFCCGGGCSSTKMENKQ